MPHVRTIFTSLTLLLAAASASAAPNIVANGDFEANLPEFFATSWTISADVFTQRVDPDTSGSATQHSGLVYTDASTDALGLLSQSLATLPGAKYTLEFDLYRLVTAGSPDNQAQIWFGATVVMDQSNVSADWTHYSFSNLSTGGASTLLQFGLRSDGSGDYPALDNVSVVMTAVPEPSVALMLAAGLVLIARQRSKRPPPF